MPEIFSLTLDVPPSAIDVNGHVNNLEYVRWMQDVAIEHSAAQGWPMQRYLQAGGSWVVRSHTIEYLRPTFAGDVIALHTWIAGMTPRSSPRRYLFWRERDRRVVARAETHWVFVDLRSGRPREIPQELSTAFPVLPDEAEVLRQLGIAEHATAA